MVSVDKDHAFPGQDLPAFVLKADKTFYSPITCPDHDPRVAQMVPTTPIYMPPKGFALASPSGGVLGIELANLHIYSICVNVGHLEKTYQVSCRIHRGIKNQKDRLRVHNNFLLQFHPISIYWMMISGPECNLHSLGSLLSKKSSQKKVVICTFCM